MKKLSFLLLIFLGSLTVIVAQTTKSFFVEFGGAYTSFQDVKYSAVGYGGIGVAFRLGFESNTPTVIWGIGLDGNYGKETPNTHNVGPVTTLHPKFYGRYLKKINDQFSVGTHWDILGLYFRDTEGLDNNGGYFITSSDLFAAGVYHRGKWNFGLDLGLLSFQKERTSFAFSAPQNALEDGAFDYQNEALENPFGFKYFTFKPIGQQLYLRTHIQYQWKERFWVGYEWTARHFAEVKNYPVTVGNHRIVVRYNFIHKTKSTTPGN